MRIVFMGTPEFAVPSLKILIEHHYEIVGVITAPDKPAGRGKQVQTSEIKQYAESKNLLILQPSNLKSVAFISELEALKADLQIVVAFRMLPEVVWEMPKLGTFNLHASLLPKYRGAAPLNWAIIRGEQETGLTTFFLQHEIDTGSIIFQEKEKIEIDDTIGTLYERMKHKGAELVLKTVRTIEKGQVNPLPQEGDSSHAPKIFREMCQIDWNTNVQEIYNFVRGLSPYPCAWTNLKGKMCKIYSVENTVNEQIEADGMIGDCCLEADKLYFLSKKGWIAIKDLQIEGKKRMNMSEFIKGFRL